MDLTSYLAIGLAFFAVAVAPGPANIANAVLAMSRGRGPSFQFSLGLTAGIAVWGAVAATGLGAVLQGSLYLLSALKVLGGLYLLYLAWQSARSATRPASEVALQTAGGNRWFLRGLMLNLSNPKTVIAWMAALAVGLDAGATPGALAWGVGVCLAVALSVNLGYMLVFSLGGMMTVYRRIRRWIDAVVAETGR